MKPVYRFRCWCWRILQHLQTPQYRQPKQHQETIFIVRLAPFVCQSAAWKKGRVSPENVSVFCVVLSKSDRPDITLMVDWA